MPARKKTPVTRRHDDNDSLSDDTCERLPARALSFLTAAGTSPRVRGALASRGYTNAEHQQGWSLLAAACGRDATPIAAGPTTTAAMIEAALAEVEAWSITSFAVARATLAQRFPRQHVAIFGDGLTFGDRYDASMAVAAFCARLEALAAPEARDDDRAALATLEQRGITASERARVLARVELVRAGVLTANDDAACDVREEIRAARRRLYAWHAEWAGIARAVITRRDLLIRMGLASPVRRKVA